ncbi:MAG TPA: efflux RND transporter periplasmic adaptor subunit [Verrucomicrobiae bacterium]|nr:efflux RND transporter periplasmic adaptor subunit [Verrucomicrobiae bacterium]
MNPPKASLDDLRIERKAKPQSGFRFWPVLIVLLVVVLGGGAFLWWHRAKPVAVTTVLAREVSTAPHSADRTVLNASGYVTARREATVSSKITGKVVEVLVEEGMKVHEGQILARLDDSNVRASLELARAQLASSKAAVGETRVRIHEADLNLKRVSQLASNNISAQADLDQAVADDSALKAHLQQQLADIEVATRTIATWEQQVEDTIIRAPFDGIVTSKNAQPGEMISPISAGGGFTRTGICTLVDMDSLEIEIDVNESYINRVQSGQPVEAALDAYPDWKIPCKVIAIVPTADRDKSTVKVRVGFQKLDPRILPDMSIKVAFREADSGKTEVTGHGVVVPKSAIHDQDGRKLVLVVQNGRAEQRAVLVDHDSEQEAVVGAGLNPGERVVADWSPGLSDGTPVTETVASK